MVLHGLFSIEICFALKFSFEASKNKAEYEALIAGLKLAKEVGVDNLEIFLDLQLVV